MAGRGLRPRPKYPLSSDLGLSFFRPSPPFGTTPISEFISPFDPDLSESGFINLRPRRFNIPSAAPPRSALPSLDSEKERGQYHAFPCPSSRLWEKREIEAIAIDQIRISSRSLD